MLLVTPLTPGMTLRMARTTKKQDRVDRIVEAQGTRPVIARFLLVNYYNHLHSKYEDLDPDSLHIEMEAYTEHLCVISHDDFLNGVAQIEEKFEHSWDEIEAKMTEILEDDD